jgi:ribonuclease HII
MSELFITDISYLGQAIQWLIGVDEVGRGSLAGPVTAAAVAIRRDWYFENKKGIEWNQVDDSKKLKPETREHIYTSALETSRQSTDYSFLFEVATGSVSEIDRLNILEATKLAMYRALKALEIRLASTGDSFPRMDEPGMFELGEGGPSHSRFSILIDGRELNSFPYQHTGIVKGDATFFCIALASILAKVERDSWMMGCSEEFPEYGWDQNKGYGTVLHCDAIKRLGLTPLHRKSFVSKMI